MRIFFLSATALGLLLVSCSIDDTNHTTDVQPFAYMAKQQTDLVMIISEVQNKCKEIDKQGAELIAEVEAMAIQLPLFRAIVDENYKSPTIAELNAPLEIAQLSCRSEVKDQLLQITEGRVTKSYAGNTAFSKNEQELLETCWLMENNGGGDSHWGNSGTRGIIAFAYGYQQSRANAVIMAVLGSLK